MICGMMVVAWIGVTKICAVRYAMRNWDIRIDKSDGYAWIVEYLMMRVT